MQGKFATPDYFKDLQVMVVDDKDYMRALLCSILYQLRVGLVQDHGNAAEAYGALAHFDPTLILTDWEMTPLDGLGFVRRIRMRDDSPNRYVPIVMVTSRSHVENILLARDAGVNDFLAKPFSAKSVYSRVRGTMEKLRPFVHSTTYFGPDRRRSDTGPPAGVTERRTEKSTKVVAA